MTSEAENTARGLRNFALFFFTLIGFIASITTIATYFQGSPHSALMVKVFPNQVLIPKYVSGYLEDDSSTRKYAKGLMNELCKGIDSNALIGLSDDGLSKIKIPKKSADEITSCRDAHAVDFVLRWNNQFGNSIGALIHYQIENVGSDIAKGIRIPSSEINSMEIRKGSTFIQIKENKEQAYFSVPDLNPNERADVYAWIVNDGMINDR